MLTQVLEEIEQKARGKVRLQAVSEAVEKVPNAERFFVDVNNPFLTFGLAKLPEPGGATRLPYEPDNDDWLRDLFALTGALASRALTGNEARQQVAAYLAALTEVQRKWASRFLLKDLRLNVGAKEIQKIVGKEKLPIFELPLAKDFKEVEPDVEEWESQPKYDGGRCVAYIDGGGGVTLLSRTGKTWGNFESVRTAVAELAAARGLRNHVLDGEVVSLDAGGNIDFQQIQQTMMRGDGQEVGALVYYLFDSCSQAEWTEPKLTYGQRLADLRAIMRGYTEAKLRVTPSKTIRYTSEEADEECRAFVAAGYEGAILRKTAGIVQNKRGKLLLKVKTFEDCEAVITGAVEGTGKYKGMLGALQCELQSGKKFEIGSGFTDKQRAEIWQERDAVIGMYASLKLFEYTNDGIPRFPIFKAIRHEADFDKET